MQVDAGQLAAGQRAILDRQRLLKGVGSFGQPALLLVGAAQALPGRPVARLQSQRGLKMGDGRGGLAQLLSGHAGQATRVLASSRTASAAS